MSASADIDHSDSPSGSRSLPDSTAMSDSPFYTSFRFSFCPSFYCLYTYHCCSAPNSHFPSLSYGSKDARYPRTGREELPLLEERDADNLNGLRIMANGFPRSSSSTIRELVDGFSKSFYSDIHSLWNRIGRHHY